MGSIRAPVTIDPIGNLPLLYSRWLGAILPGPLPVEIEATCSDCAMCQGPGDQDPAGQLFFDKDCKCCTYSPTLSNFMVGAILSDKTPALAEGRGPLLARLEKDPGNSPLAIFPSPAYALLYRHSPSAFGRNKTLRCPHFNEKSRSCSLWIYREPTCITWFCKHLRGKVGQSFWKRLYAFLNTVTKELSLWCVLQLDIGCDGLAALQSSRGEGADGENLQANEVDGHQDKEIDRKTWGPWLGREIEFYTECFKLVSTLDYGQIEKICSPEIQLSSKLLQDAYDKLKLHDIPARLKVGQFKVESTSPDAIRVWSYSRLDPLDLPVPVFMALSNFDGRPTPDVLSALDSESGVHLDTRLLRTLIDFGILEAR